MAIKTQFADDEFVALLADYALGAFAGAEPIQAGMVQTNYLLRTTQGKFVIRYYENRTIESVLFEIDLLEYLKARRYPCPGPIQNRRGESAGLHRGRPYVIFEFLEGRCLEHPEIHHKAQLIQKAAELQLLTGDFHSRYTAFRWNYTPALCRELARAEAARIGTADARVKLAWLESELAALDLPPSLPKGVCHCDFHFSNVLFQGDEFAALLDFDDANVTYPQFDLVGLIEAWAWPHTASSLDLTTARAIVHEYAKHRPLSPIEQHHLYDVYQLSILLDCVWFFARGHAADFYEKRKMEALADLGRERFLAGVLDW
jgi:homoserine kinase type II